MKAPIHLSFRQRGYTLLFFFLGLTLGFAMAAGVVWWIKGAPNPLLKPDTASDAQKEIKPISGAKRALPGGATSTAAKGANNTTSPPKPTPAAATDEEKLKLPKVPEVMFLQAGSFANSAEADNQKAMIALSGVESETQEIKLADGSTLYRVVVGPFVNRRDMENMQAQLADSDIDSIPLRHKE